ncbi:MAG: hypothetical protein QOF86_4658 [Baekduia sp.]|nr:hypothetical protein [Baekduia sp.]
MTPAELEALVERKLGGMRHLVERQLVGLEKRLRPGERLVTVAVASRRLLLGGELLLAATDQRLLVLSRSSHCEELDYDEVISVITAPPAREIAPVGEISLVTRQGVRTLVVMPGACAAEIAAAVAASIGEDRVQPPVGVAEAGRMRRALISLIISACALMGAYVVHVELQGATDGHHRSAGARDHLEHIDSLFGDPGENTINWALIETHWRDLMQVVLSIREGRLSSTLLLRRLGTESRKNNVYKAFRELGRVIRTITLLRFISEPELREEITAATNKAEAYQCFSAWLRFGHEAIERNDPAEQAKIIKFNTLLANCVIFHTALDMTAVLRQLAREGWPVAPAAIADLSPYIRERIKRFGEYATDGLTEPPAAFDPHLNFPRTGGAAPAKAGMAA